MSKKPRHKKYNPNNKYSKKNLLVNKILDMMPAASTIESENSHILSLQVRINALRTEKRPLKGNEDFSKLVGELVVGTQIADKLTRLFNNREPIEDVIDEAIDTLNKVAEYYERNGTLELSDIDAMHAFVDLYADILKEVRYEEFRKAFEAAYQEFSALEEAKNAG